MVALVNIIFLGNEFINWGSSQANNLFYEILTLTLIFYPLGLRMLAYSVTGERRLFSTLVIAKFLGTAIIISAIIVGRWMFFNGEHISPYVFRDFSVYIILLVSMMFLFALLDLSHLLVQLKRSLRSKFVLKTIWLAQSVFAVSLLFILLDLTIELSEMVTSTLGLISMVYWPCIFVYISFSTLIRIPFSRKVIRIDNAELGNEGSNVKSEIEAKSNSIIESQNLVTTFKDQYKKDDEKQDVIVNKLVHLLDKEKVFLDSRVQLSDIAERLGVSERNLSLKIKTHFNCNFRNLVNHKRVNFFISCASKADGKINVLDLAFDSGFNSKATFNRAFKYIMNQPPSDYIKSIS